MPADQPPTPSSDQTAYDVFLSYSRKDNAPIPATYPCGWVTAIRDHILADHRQFSTAPLRIFFDQHEIKDADDWRFRILGALKQSKMLLVCLSPNYFASPYCRWEWEEYLKRQVHQLMGSESVATVYFVEVPGSDEQAMAKWLTEIMRGNFTDLRPWFPEGAVALQKVDVQARMARLGESLWERLQRARRAEAAPGNLRWQNPHFVGRREELRQLHEQLGTGAVGVVTAVQGLGGQGKTELAVAYAHGWADSYPAGLWSLAAEGKKELLPLIGELAWDAALGFTPNDAQKNDPVLLGRGVLEHLKARAEAVCDSGPDRGAAALLLLDNVSEPDLLSAAQLATLPSGRGAGWLRLVATTRLDLRAQKDRLALLAVDALDPDSALTLLRDHQPPRDAQRRIVPDLEKGEPQFASDAEETAAREIVRALGGFTLAVEQVALYLGLHPDVTPSAFLATLQARGLPVADTLPQRDPDVAAQMLTQSKQLGLILDATLAKLDEAARTALRFAALLPPDTVPWPWLRALTVAQHPELGEKDDLGADPWLAVQRRLTGLRLLTPGDHPEVARIHRLVAAHLVAAPASAAGGLPEGQRPENKPAQGNALGSRPQDEASPERAGQIPAPPTHPSFSEPLDGFLGRRADILYRSQAAPAEWELDALLIALPLRLGQSATQSLATYALFLTEKIVTYRTLPAAATFLATVHEVIARLAASDPANAEWQRDLIISFERLGDIAREQGDLTAAVGHFEKSRAGWAKLIQQDPANISLQRGITVPLNKLGDLAVAQGDLAGALRSFTESKAIAERLAASDPANAAWQRDLFYSCYLIASKVFMPQERWAEALALMEQSLAISSRLAATDRSNVMWQNDERVSRNLVEQLRAKLK